MKQKINYNISFAEMQSLGKAIIAQQPEITYAQALAQVQMLKQTSCINHKLKKSRKNA